MQESKQKKILKIIIIIIIIINQMGRYHVQESKQQNCLSDLLGVQLELLLRSFDVCALEGELSS
jgi:hypothetical protein